MGNDHPKVENVRPIRQVQTQEDAGLPADVLQRILTETGQGILQVSGAGEIRDVDARVCELTGHEPQDLLGAHLSVLVPDAHEALIARIAAGRRADLQTWLARKDAGASPVAVAGARMQPDEGGEGFILLVRDRSAEEAERERQMAGEARLREAHLAAGLTCWELDVEHDRLSFSREVLDDAGLATARVESREGGLALTDARDRPALRGLFDDLAAGARESFEFSHRLAVPNGAELWVETRARVRETVAGVVKTIWGTTQNVTAQRTAQQHAAVAEEFWQATLDSLAQHVCVLDESGVILAVNQAWRDFAEANAGVGVGVGANYFDVCERAAAQEPAAALVTDALHAVASGDWKNVSVEYPCHSPDEERWFVLTANRYRGTGSSRIVVQHENVTVQRRVEGARRDSERRLREAQRVAQIGSFEIDRATRRVRLSDEMYLLYGIDQGNFEGDVDAVGALLPQGDRARLHELVDRVLTTGDEVCLEHRLESPRTPRRWFETRAEPVRDRGGCITGARGTSQEITARKMAEEDIELHAGLLDAVDASVVAADLNGRITHWNKGAAALYGWTRDEALGRTSAELFVAEEEHDHRRQYWEALLRTGHAEGEFLFHRKDTSVFRCLARAALLRDDRGLPIGAVVVAVDLTQRIESERNLRTARDFLSAVTDSMGEGLFTLDPDGNTTYVNAEAERVLGWEPDELLGRPMHAAIRRNHDGSPFRADECPIQLALERGDVARVDSDVFVRRDGTLVPVAYTSAPLETETGVRGSAVVFRDITVQKEEEERIAAELGATTMVGKVRRALCSDRLKLYAQPIVDVSTGTTVQHELLIRMLDDDGTVLAPSSFLPAAEEHGLIQDIDHWVISRAVDLAARGRNVEVNLSAKTLSQRELAGFVERELARTGADPTRVVFELTETAILGNETAARAFIDDVCGLGCRLALDDFGTGYGGFTYLKRLPVDFLKIDVEFVRDLTSNTASQHVVKAVVSLAAGFGLKTVAEGVEDARALAMLADYGVDYAQGFAIARPAPVEEVFADGRTLGGRLS